MLAAWHCDSDVNLCYNDIHDFHSLWPPFHCSDVAQIFLVEIFGPACWNIWATSEQQLENQGPDFLIAVNI